ncbi:hypothetical protein [Acidovorax sp. M2(2025)]|uniref:hypothetical protein n=1 Tax=Acidovorax sp. M2(2025) TaxID=3411355 RepID=UPI003BF4FFC7
MVTPFRTALAAFVLSTAVATAAAAPYATTYTGTVADSTIPEVRDGDRYSLTLVMDNGGATAHAQTWTPGDLQCAIWRLDSGGTAVFRHSLRAFPLETLDGNVATDAGGVLTQMASALVSDGLRTGQFSATGVALVPPVTWEADGTNNVFFDRGGPGGLPRGFGDAAGGVQMDPARWSAPRAVAGPCDDTPVVAAAPAAVPAAGGPALGLAALALAGLGGLRLRRRAGPRGQRS